MARAIAIRCFSPPDRRTPRFSYTGIIGVRETADEIVSIGLARRVDDIVIGGIQLAVGDVLPNRSVEQTRVLEHHSDLAAERTELDLSKIVTVDRDGARIRIVEAANQVDDGRANGKKVARILMMRTLTFQNSIQRSLNRASSCSSRAKHLMTRIPERLSCRVALISAIRSRATV